MGRGRRRTLSRATLAALALGAGVTWNISNVNPVADSLGPRYGVSLATVGLFTTVFSRAQATVPDAPAAAVGLVNAGAVLTIVVGVPLAGLSFSLPGDGRIGFAVIALLWAAGLLALRSAAL